MSPLPPWLWVPVSLSVSLFCACPSSGFQGCALLDLFLFPSYFQSDPLPRLLNSPSALSDHQENLIPAVCAPQPLRSCSMRAALGFFFLLGVFYPRSHDTFFLFFALEDAYYRASPLPPMELLFLFILRTPALFSFESNISFAIPFRDQ